MSSSKYNSISELKPGTYDYQIRVRVIKYWRGVTRSGQEFSNFNLILLDNKINRIHAFAPTSCADRLQHSFTLGKVCRIKNFSIQAYKPTDKFRCLRNQNQLIFSKDTEINEISGDELNIPYEVFDFHDHSELEQLSMQSTYLADVIGIINFHDELKDVTNKHGSPQKQAKFTITDGSSNVKVTFWDAYAIKFEKAMEQPIEQPVIIILSSCRVGSWNGAVDISSVPATQLYLNHKHHGVQHLRKLLTNPEFANQVFAKPQIRRTEFLSIDAIKKLGKEYIDSEVIAHIVITDIDINRKWYFFACTNCDTETEVRDNYHICNSCSRIVPHPEIRYKILVFGTDSTGVLQILLEDREVRTLIGKRARQLIEEFKDVEDLPPFFVNLKSKNYTVMIKISETNVINHIDLYWAISICNDFVYEEPKIAHLSNERGDSSYQVTSYSQQELSQVSFGAN